MSQGKIIPGTIVSPISSNRGIAVFKSTSGSRFIKVKEEEGVWKAITLLDYRGPGLVIFLSNTTNVNDLQQIGPGEILKSNLKVKVTSVYDRHAVGEIVSEFKYCSLEEAFNDLVQIIDTDNAQSESINFGEETFNKEDFALILKLQAALYRYRNNPKELVGNSKNENGVSATINGNH